MLGPEDGAGKGEGAGASGLVRFAWLAVAAALLTMALKTGAWALTGSVGFLSDAAESIVNLVAAVVAVVVLRVAAKPPDEGHNFGHAKAEYFSAGVEGLMILLAAAAIIVTAVERLLHPITLENVGLGLVVSAVAGAVNGAVAVVLLRAGRAHRSLTLTADGKHLLTDVWTSVGVIVGVFLVAVTGVERLDPVVGLAVAANILLTGARLLGRSVSGLMDHALPPPARAQVERALAALVAERGVDFHGLRTRESGRHQIVAVHLVVPGDWSVRRAHDLVAEVEAVVADVLQRGEAQVHLEPRGVPCPLETREEPHPGTPAG